VLTVIVLAKAPLAAASRCEPQDAAASKPCSRHHRCCPAPCPARNLPIHLPNLPGSGCCVCSAHVRAHLQTPTSPHTCQNLDAGLVRGFTAARGNEHVEDAAAHLRVRARACSSRKQGSPMPRMGQEHEGSHESGTSVCIYLCACKRAHACVRVCASVRALERLH